MPGDLSIANCKAHETGGQEDENEKIHSEYIHYDLQDS
jgi:hypothetical protein